MRMQIIMWYMPRIFYPKAKHNNPNLQQQLAQIINKASLMLHFFMGLKTARAAIFIAKGRTRPLNREKVVLTYSVERGWSQAYTESSTAVAVKRLFVRYQLQPRSTHRVWTTFPALSC
jgi:hypothetical protein